MSLFVTGTGTDVGKTLVCAALLHRYGAGRRLAYWKPIATGVAAGARDDNDGNNNNDNNDGPEQASGERPSMPSDRQRIVQLAGERAEVLPELYRYEPAVSPHLASRWAGERIDAQRILDAWHTHRRRAHTTAIVLEGIGGWLVPLHDDGLLLADVVRQLEVACLLVATSAVGTLNHTLLTLASMRARGVEPAGVIVSGERNPDNVAAIERFGQTRVLGELPLMPAIDAATLADHAKHIDPHNALARHLDEI